MSTHRRGLLEGAPTGQTRGDLTTQTKIKVSDDHKPLKNTFGYASFLKLENMKELGCLASKGKLGSVHFNLV